MNCSNCHGVITNNEEVVYSIVDNAPMHSDCANKCITCGSFLTDQQVMKNKCKCVTQPKSSIEMVRRSHIEDYRKCPHYFKLAVIKGLEVETNAYALHGIMLHEIFDKYSLLENYTLEAMREEWVERYNAEMPKDNISFKGKERLYDELFEKGYDAIDTFFAFRNSVGLPFVTEENIRFKLREDLPEVSITMDRLDRDGDGEFVLYDYKCGKTYTGKKLEDDLQLPLYCEAIRQRYGKLPKQFIFLFVSEGKERIYTNDGSGNYTCTVRKREYTINIDEKLKYTESILANIAKEKFGTMCNNHWHCENMCGYHKIGKCDGNKQIQGGWNL